MCQPSTKCPANSGRERNFPNNLDRSGDAFGSSSHLTKEVTSWSTSSARGLVSSISNGLAPRDRCANTTPRAWCRVRTATTLLPTTSATVSRSSDGPLASRRDAKTVGTNTLSVYGSKDDPVPERDDVRSVAAVTSADLGKGLLLLWPPWGSRLFNSWKRAERTTSGGNKRICCSRGLVEVFEGAVRRE